MAKLTKKAFLVLQDGTVFEGKGFGANGLREGEVVFNTSMSGYQEIITDPSYTGQIILFTYPQIGNVGVNSLDEESNAVFCSGVVIKELSSVESNYRSKQSLSDYLKENKIPGIAEIDTRALVRHIRDKGAMPAVIAVGNKYKIADLKKKAKNLAEMAGQNFAEQVTCDKAYSFKHGTEPYIKGVKKVKLSKAKYKVVAYDFGVKKNILRLLVDHGCDVKVVPYDYPAEKILNSKDRIDGVFLSNGPGDPEPCEKAIQNVKELLGKKPLFGICLGHQILSLALGAQTYKLKFGHHGGNQPVKNIETGRIEITAQNHGFAVKPESIPSDVVVTHIHQNDQTISGIKHKKLPAFSVQYHPEASPGPHDSQYLFQNFVDLMEANRNA